MTFMVFPLHFRSFVVNSIIIFLANGFKIDSQVDSGFHINVNSGFQSTRFRIPVANISWFRIPNSVTWGELPYVTESTEVLDSGFHPLDSEFQFSGSQFPTSWIMDSNHLHSRFLPRGSKIPTFMFLFMFVAS